MSDVSPAAPMRPRPALWLLVFAAPALRTSLLGALLVTEGAMGRAFGLDAEALAILVESVVFGGLLAVFLVPPLVARVGARRMSVAVALVTIVGLTSAITVGPLTSSSLDAKLSLFVVAALLGFCVAIPSPVSQSLLNSVAATDNAARSLQSVWSAGQPAGFILASAAGGLLVQQFGWWTALMVPLGFAILTAISLLDRAATSEPRQIDASPAPGLGDLVWIVAALIAFEIWTSWGSLRSWFEPGVLAALAATIALTALALGRLRNSPNPAISLAPFSVPSFAAATTVLFVYQLPTTAEFEVLLLSELSRMSAEDIGARSAIGNVAQIAGAALGAVLLFRSRAAFALTAGLILTLLGLAGYLFYPWWDGFAFVAATRALVGFGGGLLTPVLFVIAFSRMPEAFHVAAGTWLVLAMIGGTEVGLALFDFVLEVATGIAGGARAGYVLVESAQMAVGVATAILATWCAARERLSLKPACEPLHPMQPRATSEPHDVVRSSSDGTAA